MACGKRGRECAGGGGGGRAVASVHGELCAVEWDRGGGRGAAEPDAADVFAAVGADLFLLVTGVYTEDAGHGRRATKRADTRWRG